MKGLKTLTRICASLLIMLVNQIVFIASRLRAWLFQVNRQKRQILPGTVISVGNLSAGGTGKSPMVMVLASHLKSKGASPAILTRGYRSGLKDDQAICLVGSALHLLRGPHPGDFQGDEARMQAEILQNIPVIIGAKRFLAAKAFMEHFEAPSHWILDDGFQHHQISRDLDLVLVDASHPRGRLDRPSTIFQREPIGAIRRAHHVFLTRWDPTTFRPAIEDTLEAFGIPFTRVPFHYDLIPWAEKTPWPRQISLVTSIADPKRIQDAWPENFPILTGTLFGRDHESIDVKELKILEDKSESLCTTEKDYWRNPSVFQGLKTPLFILKLTPIINDLTLSEVLLNARVSATKKGL